MMESLKEDSLMEEEMHSFRGAGDKNRRQGNFSARVFLMKPTKSEKNCDLQFKMSESGGMIKKNVVTLVSKIYLYLLWMMA